MKDVSRATIVISPRERFSEAARSLRDVIEHTAGPYELVYVDGGSPRRLARWLREQADAHGFELIRENRYLSPNEARNIGLTHVRTEYAVFMDNDVLVRPGWLTTLIECADATGASVVSPLTCEGDFDTIHFAGGDVSVEEDREDEAVVRHVREKMRFPQRKIASVQDQLVREETNLCEFHCVLVRKAILDQIGPFDEGLLNTREHLDFTLEVTRAGGTVWVEPESVVAYVPPPPLALTDLHFYMLRWSDEWERRSLSRFREKWDLAEDEFFRRRLRRLGWRRHRSVVAPIVRRVTRGRGSERLEAALKKGDRVVNRRITDRYQRLRAAAG